VKNSAKPVLGAVQHELVRLRVVDGRGLQRRGVRPRLGLGERERRDPFPRREPREPALLLLLGAVEEQALHPDRLVPADQDRQRRVGPADLLGDAAVRGGREAVAAVGLGDRHAEGAQLAQTPDDVETDRVVALDLRGVDAVLREAAEGVEERGDGLALRRVDLGVRKHRVLRDLAGEERLDDGGEAGLDVGGGGAIVGHAVISLAVEDESG
jgi:hypothetical protein